MSELATSVKRLIWITSTLVAVVIGLVVYVVIDGGNKHDALERQQRTLTAQQVSLRHAQQDLLQQQQALKTQQQALKDLAARNTKSLCAFRHDLERRVASGRLYLRTTPHAIPGISPAQIRLSIRNQQRSLDSLHSLICVRRR